MVHKSLRFVLFASFLLPTVASAAEPQKNTDNNNHRDGSPWSYSVGIGVPKLESGVFRLIGDGRLGYAFRDWGMSGDLDFASYANSTQQAYASTSRSSGGIQAWKDLGKTQDRMYYKLQGELSYASYATTYIMLEESSQGFQMETSGMMRATGLAGFHYQVSSLIHTSIDGGLGLQNENYGTFSDEVAEVGSNSSVRFTAQLKGTWMVLESLLRLRVQSDMGYQSITRTRLVVDSDVSNTEPLQAQRFKQLEMNNRIFGDLPPLTFGGFTPTAFLGLDVMRIQGDAGNSSTLVPLGGIGFTEAITH